jgi:hypothetical protein
MHSGQSEGSTEHSDIKAGRLQMCAHCDSASAFALALPADKQSMNAVFVYSFTNSAKLMISSQTLINASILNVPFHPYRSTQRMS